MRQLNGIFTQSFNRRHRRVGHLFQARFKAILVEKESYLLELSRYIEPIKPRLERILVKRGESGIAEVYREHGYRLREIAAHLGVHYATVSRRLKSRGNDLVLSDCKPCPAPKPIVFPSIQRV